MIGIVATLKVAEGKNAEFEAIFAELAAQVRANEPGNVFYQLTKSRADGQVYKVLELYTDQEAVALHGQTEHYKAVGPKMGGFLAGRPEVEFLDGVG